MERTSSYVRAPGGDIAVERGEKRKAKSFVWGRTPGASRSPRRSRSVQRRREESVSGDRSLRARELRKPRPSKGTSKLAPNGPCASSSHRPAWARVKLVVHAARREQCIELDLESLTSGRCPSGRRGRAAGTEVEGAERLQQRAKEGRNDGRSPPEPHRCTRERLPDKAGRALA